MEDLRKGGFRIEVGKGENGVGVWEFEEMYWEMVGVFVRWLI